MHSRFLQLVFMNVYVYFCFPSGKSALSVYTRYREFKSYLLKTKWQADTVKGHLLRYFVCRFFLFYYYYYYYFLIVRSFVTLSSFYRQGSYMESDSIKYLQDNRETICFLLKHDLSRGMGAMDERAYGSTTYYYFHVVITCSYQPLENYLSHKERAISAFLRKDYRSQFMRFW